MKNQIEFHFHGKIVQKTSWNITKIQCFLETISLKAEWFHLGTFGQDVSF